MSQFLQSDKKEYVISNQILKSGTSVGALIREGEYGQSKADFINKMSIALKEANETEYWLNILRETDYIDENLYLSLTDDCKNLLRLLIASVKTSKASI